MTPRIARFALFTFAVVVSATDSANAYRRMKWGPFELVPSLAASLRSHDNVYVASDADLSAKTSGVILDVRPGLNLTFKPNLQKKVRGLFLDLRYQPSLSLFPGAGLTCVVGSTDPRERPCANGENADPDKFKLDHNLSLGLRYQTSSRFSLSAGLDYSQPEFSKANLSLKDFQAHTGGKFDFTKTMSIQANVRGTLFETPTNRLRPDGSVVTESTPFGTFDELTTDAAYEWRVLRTLTFGAHYSRTTRKFDGFAATSSGDDPGNFNKDDIDEDIKSYTQQQAHISLTKRLTRQINGSFDFGYIWRDNDQRQFGPGSYGDYLVRTMWDTLLGKRTKLQATLDYQLTDTVRRLGFTDVNAFTNDQLGQFSILPEEFGIAKSRRAVLDVTRSVFRRGDQVIVGVAWQKNELRDQFGSGNFFRANGNANGIELEARDLGKEGVCEIRSLDPSNPSANVVFCKTILNDVDETKLLLTAGYRLRLKSWLGLEAKGAIYDGTTTQLPKDPLRRQPVDLTVKTNYWNASAGFVINIQALN